MASLISRILARLNGQKQYSRSGSRTRNRKLRVESMESRRLLAGDLGVISGNVYTDLTDDGLDVGDVAIASATVNLYLDDGDTIFEPGTDDVLVGTGSGVGGGTGIAVTDVNGDYRFDGLTDGTYFVAQQAVSGQLQRTSEAVKTVTLTVGDSTGVETLVIDMFDTVTTPDPLDAAAGTIETNQVSTGIGEALGDERDVVVDNDIGSTSNLQFDINGGTGVLIIDAGVGTAGSVVISYDGVDGDASTIDHATLTPVDLTASDGTAFYFKVGSQSGSTMTVDVFSNATDFSSATLVLPTTAGGAPDEDVFIRFTDFIADLGGAGADFTSVSAIRIQIDVAAADDTSFDFISIVAPTVSTQTFANLNPMSIGNTVFNDLNDNGMLDIGENGIQGVSVELYEDTNANGSYDDGVDTQVGVATTTDINGNYAFSDLLPGDYIVFIPIAEFATNADPLFGFLSSSGNDPAPDADTDATDGDDNGILIAGIGVATAAFTLASGDEPDTATGGDDNLNVDFGFVPQIDLEVTKTAGGVTSVVAGDQLTYTITVTNNGDAAAENVVVTDDLPNLSPDALTIVSVVSASGNGVVTQTGNSAGEIEVAYTSLASLASDTITVVVTVPAAAAAAAAITNSVSVTGDGNDTDLTNNDATVDVEVTRSASLQITKTDTPDPAGVGDDLTYEITVTNVGPSTATNLVVSDTLASGLTFVSAAESTGTGTAGEAAGVVTANIPTLAVGASVTVTIVATIDSTFGGSTIPNSATADADEAVLVTGTASTTVNPQVDLAITKSDSADPVSLGGQLTYTIDVVNNGPSQATNVEVVDTLPAGVTFVSATGGTVTAPIGGSTDVTIAVGTLASGGSAQVTILVDVDQTAGASFSNTAIVRSTESINGFDSNTTNNTDTETTATQTTVDLEITKSDSVDPVSPGNSFTYTLVVTNNGPTDATLVNVTDIIPDGIQITSATSTVGTVTNPTSAQDTTAANPDDLTVAIGNLASGASATITVNATVLSDTRGTLSNTATVATGDTNAVESDSTNNTATETTALNPTVDLRVTKTDAVDPTIAGNNLTYTIVVTNDGPSSATNVTLTDTLPAGVTFSSVTSSQGSASAASGVVTASIGTLAPAASATITLIVGVDGDTRGTLSNTATATATETEIDSTNNSATATTTVNGSVDVAITKTDSLDPAGAGGTLSYTIVVTNNGPSDATSVVMTDTLPASLSFTSASSTVGSVSNVANAVTANVGTLASGASATITINAGVLSTATGTISNTATVTSAETDTNSANNSATQTTDIAVPGSIAGAVYLDANRNGVRDSGEEGISGVIITVSGTDILGTLIDDSQATDTNGNYLFEDLLPGTYTLTQTQPEGLGDGQTNVGTGATGTAGTNEITTVVLGSGATATAFNFGELNSPLSKRRLLASATAGD